MHTDYYNALYERNNYRVLINFRAIDSNHAQAQAVDTARALMCETFNLNYGFNFRANKVLSDLFERLAHSSFEHRTCYEWEGSKVNKNPCIYVLKERYYLRPLILRYLDIDKTEVVTKMTCKNKHCINPYHFEYVDGKNSKLTGGDRRMLLAFLRDGVGIPAIANALNVHRSTIYRKLTDERIRSRTSN